MKKKESVRGHAFAKWAAAASFLALLLMSSPSCAPEGSSQELVLSGAWAVYPTAVAWAQAYRKAHPGVRIEVTAGGAGKGAADVIAGLVDIGMVSREPDPSELERGVVPVYVLHDAVFPVISERNPSALALAEKGMKAEAFEKLYIQGAKMTWGDLTGDRSSAIVHVYTRSDSCGAAAAFAKFIGGRKQEDLRGIGIYGDPGILDAVGKDPRGIGYANFSYVFGKDGRPLRGIAIVPVDADNDGRADTWERISARDEAVRAIESKRYPAVRKNYFFLKGEITGLRKDFLRFVLSDEGERIVLATGASLPVPKKEREAALKRLKLE